MQQLDVAAIRTALRALAEELAALHERGELLVVGGAAMALLYGARPVTKDVDVYIAKPEETDVVRRAARRVAEALGLPDDWLNDGAKGFIHGLALGDTVFEHDALTVRALAPEQLLAMKLCAWRDAIDFEDARLLLTKVRGERAQVWAKLEPFLLPGRETTACYAFDDIWESCHDPHHAG
jgi:hypothetical protein